MGRGDDSWNDDEMSPRKGRRDAGRSEDLYDDDFDYDDEDDSEPPRKRSRRRSRSQRPGREKSGGFDWGAAEEEPDERDETGDFGYGAPERPPRERPRRRPRRRKTLMDLCTPVFAYASVLPREGESTGVEPSYESFRDQVLAALRAVEEQAAAHRIEAEDATEAVYALSLFIDGQVLESEWSGKARWAGEPLHIVLHNDPAGGINFFNRLEALAERQKAVKDVYLTCLSFGYRGRYAELDPTEQATQIGALRQKVLREIHARPLDQRRALFPEAYTEAEPITDRVPPPPKWWMFASLGVVAVVLVVWLVMFWIAGRLPEDADRTVRGVVAELSSSSSAGTALTPDPPTAEQAPEGRP